VVRTRKLELVALGELMRDERVNAGLSAEVRSFLEAALEGYPDLDVRLLAAARKRETSGEGREAGEGEAPRGPARRALGWGRAPAPPSVGHGRPKEDRIAVRALHGLAFRGTKRARSQDCMGLRAPHGVAFCGANRAGRFLALPDGAAETPHRVSGPS
jgi:hypothetical protein